MKTEATTALQHPPTADKKKDPEGVSVISEDEIDTDDEVNMRRIHRDIVTRKKQKQGKVQPWKGNQNPFEYEEEDGDSKSAGG